MENLEHCIADIRLWMTQTLLKLNDLKTDIIYGIRTYTPPPGGICPGGICPRTIIYISSPYNAKSIKTPELQIGESCITPSGSVRDPGIIFDIFLDRIDHVTSVCRASYYHLKNIHSLKTVLVTRSRRCDSIFDLQIYPQIYMKQTADCQ